MNSSLAYPYVVHYLSRVKYFDSEYVYEFRKALSHRGHHSQGAEPGVPVWLRHHGGDRAAQWNGVSGTAAVGAGRLGFFKLGGGAAGVEGTASGAALLYAYATGQRSGVDGYQALPAAFAAYS